MTKPVKVIYSIAIIVIFLAVVIGIFCVLSYSTPGRELNKQIVDIQSKGRPISYDDIRKTSVPKESNAAIIYETIFSRLGSNIESDSKLFADFTRSNKRQNDPSLLPKTKHAAERYQNIIPLIEKAALKPECSFVYTWTDDLFEVRNYLKSIGFLRRLLCTNAILNSKKHLMKEAYRDIGLSFKLGDSLQQEPWLVGQFFRISILQKSSLALREVLNSGDLSETNLLHLYNMLSKIDLNVGLVKALEGETATGITLYKQLTSSTQSTIHGRPVPKSGIFFRSIIYNDESFFLDYMNTCTKHVQKPYSELKITSKMPSPPRIHLVSEILTPDIRKLWQKRDSGIAEINGSQILLALKAYRSRYNAYPTDLNELRNKLGWKIPEDPFSGVDFIYKTKNKGFIFYSLGANLKDDGGIPIPYTEDSKQNKATSNVSGDIVWQMER